MELSTCVRCPNCGKAADIELLNEKSGMLVCKWCKHKFNYLKAKEDLQLQVPQEFSFESLPARDASYQETVDGARWSLSAGSFARTWVIFLIPFLAAGGLWMEYSKNPYAVEVDSHTQFKFAMAGLAIVGFWIYALYLTFRRVRCVYSKKEGVLRVFSGVWGIGSRRVISLQKVKTADVYGHQERSREGGKRLILEVRVVRHEGPWITFGRGLSEGELTYLACVIRKLAGEYQGVGVVIPAPKMSPEAVEKMLDEQDREEFGDEYDDDEPVSEEELHRLDVETTFWIPDNFNPAKAPEGVRVEQADEGVRIVCRVREWGTLVILFFVALTVTLASMGGCYGYQIANGFDLTTTLVGIPFIIISTVLWLYTLYYFNGRVKVTLDPEMGRVFTGFWIFGRRRTFRIADVTGVDKDREKYNRYTGETEKKTSVHIELKDGDIALSSLLTVKQKNYLSDTLRSLMRAVK